MATRIARVLSSPPEYSAIALGIILKKVSIKEVSSKQKKINESIVLLLTA
jgi:hypothetical protein